MSSSSKKRKDHDDAGTDDEDVNDHTTTTQMRESVPKTVANPLGGTCRREFKKVMSKMQRVDGAMFNSVDTDVMKIMECLSNISESVYDTYAKAAKRVGGEGGAIAIATTTVEPSTLMVVLANGKKAIEEVAQSKNQYALLQATHDKHRDLYVQLYHASCMVVDECMKTCPLYAEALRNILEV